MCVILLVLSSYTNKVILGVIRVWPDNVKAINNNKKEGVFSTIGIFEQRNWPEMVSNVNWMFYRGVGLKFRLTVQFERA